MPICKCTCHEECFGDGHCKMCSHKYAYNCVSIFRDDLPKQVFVLPPNPDTSLKCTGMETRRFVSGSNLPSSEDLTPPYDEELPKFPSLNELHRAVPVGQLYPQSSINEKVYSFRCQQFRGYTKCDTVVTLPFSAVANLPFKPTVCELCLDNLLDKWKRLGVSQDMKLRELISYGFIEKPRVLLAEEPVGRVGDTEKNGTPL